MAGERVRSEATHMDNRRALRQVHAGSRPGHRGDAPAGAPPRAARGSTRAGGPARHAPPRPVAHPSPQGRGPGEPAMTAWFHAHLVTCLSWSVIALVVTVSWLTRVL